MIGTDNSQLTELEKYADFVEQTSKVHDRLALENYHTWTQLEQTLIARGKLQDRSEAKKPDDCFIDNTSGGTPKPDTTLETFAQTGSQEDPNYPALYQGRACLVLSRTDRPDSSKLETLNEIQKDIEERISRLKGIYLPKVQNRLQEVLDPNFVLDYNIDPYPDSDAVEVDFTIAAFEKQILGALALSSGTNQTVSTVSANDEEFAPQSWVQCDQEILQSYLQDPEISRKIRSKSIELVEKVMRYVADSNEPGGPHYTLYHAYWGVRVARDCEPSGSRRVVQVHGGRPYQRDPLYNTFFVRDPSIANDSQSHSSECAQPDTVDL
ncbi:hypothetical protein I302_100060 [Kwoniella bestiolae CBS 10118]|uniref:Uncharacterized protein n=1 Tax=Kwoniella bestiolae CBS 10118 TaxID=1296100 RepID=A0A1B9G400_9TREE|nr:hypothetical protein I302_03432 [Kwoniella bestiolae CBS 10118]OCF25759.1 hypothetical protein I302_03432 [Kwoniella bestiolae CBS 10118]